MDNLIKDLQDTIADKFITNKGELQTRLNNLLQKNGVISQQDFNDTYDLIRKSKQDAVENMYVQDKHRTMRTIIIGGIFAFGIYYLLKK
jgi:hypothetical protein